MKLFCKLHIMYTLHGMACATAVTPAKANDSPHRHLMMYTLPGDRGILTDAAYGCVKNCNTISSSWRAVINSKLNTMIKGFNARAELLKFRKGRPGTFYRILHLWNNVKECLLVHEGTVWCGRARPQGEGTVGGAAIHDYLLQHGLCLRLHHGNGTSAAIGMLRTTARGPLSGMAPVCSKNVIRSYPEPSCRPDVPVGIQECRQF